MIYLVLLLLVGIFGLFLWRFTQEKKLGDTKEMHTHTMDKSFSKTNDTKQAPYISEEIYNEEGMFEEDLIQISVKTKPGHPPFDGKKIQKLLTTYELSPGQFSIFHSYYLDGSYKRLNFSIMNGEDDGKLEASNLSELKTHSLLFLMDYTRSNSPIFSFRKMLDIATIFAGELEGQVFKGEDMFDENIRLAAEEKIRQHLLKSSL